LLGTAGTQKASAAFLAVYILQTFTNSMNRIAVCLLLSAFANASQPVKHDASTSGVTVGEAIHDNSKHSNTGVVNTADVAPTTIFAEGHTNFAVSGSRGAAGSVAEAEMEDGASSIEWKKDEVAKKKKEKSSNTMFYVAGGGLIVLAFLVYSTSSSNNNNDTPTTTMALSNAQSL
jgi:hypothetical protein